MEWVVAVCMVQTCCKLAQATCLHPKAPNTHGFKPQTHLQPLVRHPDAGLLRQRDRAGADPAKRLHARGPAQVDAVHAERHLQVA